MDMFVIVARHSFIVLIKLHKGPHGDSKIDMQEDNVWDPTKHMYLFKTQPFTMAFNLK